MFKKIIEPFILGVIVSFYFFPIGLTFLPPTVNTKMILAVLGAVIYVFDCVRARSMVLDKDVFISTLIAFLFSAVCYLSTFINVTEDFSYANYFVSFFTWLGGAYAVIFFLKLRYRTVDIDIVAKYLFWVAVAQCISCLMIDNIPAFSAFVDTWMNIGQGSVRELNRKYGIGSALDAGGVRFAAILVLSPYYLCRRVFAEDGVGKSMWHVLAFFFIIMVGNMISRTTTVGALIGIGYILLYIFKINKGMVSSDRVRSFFSIVLILAIFVPIVAFLYNTDPGMRADLRFAFEGFFNWAETGEWSTASTDKLNGEMWVWPEDLRTWIIGSGLFEGFIYSTDIGYCRFILYCGIAGFSIFSFFFVHNAFSVLRKYQGTGLLCLLLLSLTFVIWIKVATDIFMLYALLFCADKFADEDSEKEDALPDSQSADDLDAKLARWAARPVGNDNQ